MTVFGHGPANCDLCILDRFAVSGLDLEFPGMDIAHRHSLGITCVCDLECSCLRNHGLCVSSVIGRLYLSACSTVRAFAVFTTFAATLAVHLAVTAAHTCFTVSALAVLAALTAFVPCFAVAVCLACFAMFAFAIFSAPATFSVFTVLAVTFALACRRVIAFTILPALAFCIGIGRAYYRRPCHRSDKENGKQDYSKLFNHDPLQWYNFKTRH